MIYIIKDRITLNRLQNDKTLRKELHSIKVELNVDSEEILSFERKINRYYFACGCTAGKIAIIFILLIYGLIWLMDRNSVYLVWWKIASGIFGAALLGKASGLVLSHYLLKKTYSGLNRLLV